MLLAAAELSFRLGHYAESRFDEKTREQTSVIAGSLLAVLGMLLGFTVSMAVTRFETRKQLVLDEANAIGTSYLRAQLLPVTGTGPHLYCESPARVCRSAPPAFSCWDRSAQNNAKALKTARDETASLQK